MNRCTAVGVALLAVGVVLAANPLYLGYLLPYPTPGDGFRFTGVYHAQLGVLGLLAAPSGAYALARRWPMSPRTAGLGAVFAYMAAAGSAWHGLVGLFLSTGSADLLGVPFAGLALVVFSLVLGLGFDRLAGG